MGISELHGVETVLVMCWEMLSQISWEDLSYPYKCMQTEAGREEKNLLLPASLHCCESNKWDKNEEKLPDVQLGLESNHDK